MFFFVAADVLPSSSSSTSKTSNNILWYLRANSCFIIWWRAPFGGLFTPVLGWFVGGFSGVWWLVGFWFSLANWSNWVKWSFHVKFQIHPKFRGDCRVCCEVVGWSWFQIITMCNLNPSCIELEMRFWQEPLFWYPCIKENLILYLLNIIGTIISSGI